MTPETGKYLTNGLKRVIIELKLKLMDSKRLRPVVNDPKIWEVLQEYFKFSYDKKHSEMDNLTELRDLYRAQGYCQAMKELRNLRERVNAKS